MPAPNLMAIHHVQTIQLVCTGRKSRGIKYISEGFILWEQWMFSQSFMPIHRVEMKIFHWKSETFLPVGYQERTGLPKSFRGNPFSSCWDICRQTNRLTIAVHVSVVLVTKRLFVDRAASKMILWKLYLTLQSSHQQQWILGLLRWLVHNGGTTFSRASVMFGRH